MRTLQQARRERDAWKDTAAMFLRNQEFFSNVINRIGAVFGRAAKTCDDGSVTTDVLVLKVPELVEALHAEVNRPMEDYRLLWDELQNTLNELPPQTAETIRTQIGRLFKAMRRQQTVVEDETAEVVSDANLCMTNLLFDRDALQREKSELERRLDD